MNNVADQARLVFGREEATEPAMPRGGGRTCTEVECWQVVLLSGLFR